MLPLLLLLLLLSTAFFTNAQKYNEVYMKSSHNSYERREGYLDQLIYHHIRSIEIDCHLGIRPGQFRVYHDAGMLQSYSSISTLRDGILLLREFNQMYPNHHVVTVFVDLKGGLGTTHTWQDYDDHLSRLPLWTPSDARPNNESSIQQGIDENGWPTLEELRGKFIWILTSGAKDYCDSDETCNVRKSFISTAIKQNGAEGIAQVGKLSHVVFYNQNSNYEDVGPAVFDAGYIGRVYDSADINSKEKWNNAIEHKFHHITTDRINFHRDSFSRTHNFYGYPFELYNGTSTQDWKPNEGQDSIMYLYADNGDTWGLTDDLNFIIMNDESQDEWIEYTTSVAMVNSHCNKFAKAGLMLKMERNEEFPIGSGPYFGIVRCCDALARVQYRDVAFSYTVSDIIPDESFDGSEVAKRMTFKLRYLYKNNSTLAEAYYKVEGTDNAFVLMRRHLFPKIRLNLHGLFASSHYWKGNDDDTQFKALFVNTKRNNETITSANISFTYSREQTMNEEQWGDGYYAPNDASLPKPSQE